MSPPNASYSEFSRQELYELVWSEPRKIIVERLGVSSAAFGKTCERFRIPLPSARYWSLPLAERTASRPPLPHRLPGTFDVVRFGDWSKRRDCVRVFRPPHFGEDIAAFRSRITGEIALLAKPSQIVRLSKQIERISARDEARSRKVEGWEHPGLVRMFGPQLGDAQGRRWLAVLSYLERSIIHFGGQLSVRGGDASDITLTVGSVPIALRFKSGAAVERELAQSPSRTGGDQLELVEPNWLSAERRRWQNILADPDKTVPNALADLLVIGEQSMRFVALKNYEADQAMREREEKEQHLAREQEAKNRVLREKQRREADLQALLDQSQAYREVQDIRALIAEVKKQFGGELRAQEWVKWAEEQTRLRDPLSSANWNDTPLSKMNLKDDEGC